LVEIDPAYARRCTFFPSFECGNISYKKDQIIEKTDEVKASHPILKPSGGNSPTT